VWGSLTSVATGFHRMGFLMTALALLPCIFSVQYGSNSGDVGLVFETLGCATYSKTFDCSVARSGQCQETFWYAVT
jgi:hypothetical protein